VRFVVNDVCDQVPDGHVVIVHGDPAAAELEIHAKFLDGWQIIVRHRVHVYGAEKRTGLQFDRRQVPQIGFS